MRGLGGMESVPVPERWRREAFFARLATRGLCTLGDLHSPATTMRMVFSGLRMLDMEDYLELKSRERAGRTR